MPRSCEALHLIQSIVLIAMAGALGSYTATWARTLSTWMQFSEASQKSGYGKSHQISTEKTR